MKRALTAGLVLATLMALSANAAADVPNPPPECVGKSAGDACSFQNGDTGTCQDVSGELTCVVSSGGGGDGDGESSDDGGCSTAPGGHGSTGGWLLLGLAGIAAASRRRR